MEWPLAPIFSVKGAMSTRVKKNESEIIECAAVRITVSRTFLKKCLKKDVFTPSELARLDKYLQKIEAGENTLSHYRSIVEKCLRKRDLT